MGLGIAIKFFWSFIVEHQEKRIGRQFWNVRSRGFRLGGITEAFISIKYAPHT